jgi:hypothetical protein
MTFLCENLHGGCMFPIARLAALRVTDLGTDEIALTVILNDKPTTLKRQCLFKIRAVTSRPVA